jgi:membrane protease YdiL (CAAX protease family)
MGVSFPIYCRTRNNCKERDGSKTGMIACAPPTSSSPLLDALIHSSSLSVKVSPERSKTPAPAAHRKSHLSATEQLGDRSPNDHAHHFSVRRSPMAVNVKKVALFLVLTFALTYLLAICYFQAGGSVEMPGILIFGVIYMFMPALCAVVVQRFIYRATLVKPLRIHFRPNRWFLVAWLLPLFIAFAAFGVALLFPGVTFSPNEKDNFRYLLLKPKHFGIEIETNRYAWAVFLTLLQGLLTGITANALAGFGEELGWRGFLQRELAAPGFWKAAVIIGLAWGLWHAPLIVQGFNYPDHPWLGVFVMAVESTLLAPLFAYVCLKANSVVAASILHGSYNGMSVLATMGLEGGNDLTVGVCGLAGLIVLVVANVGLMAFDRWFGGNAITRGFSQQPPGEFNSKGGD